MYVNVYQCVCTCTYVYINIYLVFVCACSQVRVYTVKSLLYERMCMTACVRACLTLEANNLGMIYLTIYKKIIFLKTRFEMF
jgi:hypothetical protein